MHISTLTPPSGEPLSLADAKRFARIGNDLEDTLMTQLVAVARSRIEAETSLALMSRTLRLTLTEWPVNVLERGVFRLPRRPAQSLAAVRLTDGEASEDITDQFALTPGLCPVLKPVVTGGWTWPRSISQWIEIDWVAGFGAAEDVPEALTHAVSLCVAHAFEHRDASDWRAQDELTGRVEALLQPWREVQL